MPITIYHNPRCSKSRKALEILQERSLELNIIEYLKTGFSRDEILSLKEKLKKEMIDLVRVNEEDFKKLNLNNPSENELVDALITNPKILQRPIVIFDDQALIARPAEILEELFRNN